MTDLDIGVIYTYEQQWMRQLLSTMAGCTGSLKTRLLLVDNASKDGVEPFTGYFPTTEVLRNRRRLFYAANLNRVLEAASARYVLLLNTDVYFPPHEPCLAQMVRFMDQHPDCGLAGCRIYHPDGQDAHAARRFQTLPIILARRLGLKSLFPHTLDRYFYRERDIEGAWECDWVSGCFMLVRREAYQDVGTFDTRFVKYFEDLDYCLRMAQAGWRVMYNGAVHCYHVESRASHRLFSPDAVRHFTSYLRWLQKWGLAPARHIAPRPQYRRAA
jgi:GT2 family glycosyltransferase